MKVSLGRRAYEFYFRIRGVCRQTSCFNFSTSHPNPTRRHITVVDGTRRPAQPAFIYFSSSRPYDNGPHTITTHHYQRSTQGSDDLSQE